MHYIRTGRFYKRLKLLLSWEGRKRKTKDRGENSIKLVLVSSRIETPPQIFYDVYYYRILLSVVGAVVEKTRVWVDEGGRCGSSDRSV